MDMKNTKTEKIFIEQIEGEKMKLKEITFILDNGAVTIPGKYIGDFIADDIRTSISRHACNEISRMDICHRFFIEISKEANVEYRRFEIGNESVSETTFDCLRNSDIYAIDFTLEESFPLENTLPEIEHYTYYVHWSGNDEENNESEKRYVSTVGNLYILISENEKMNDVLNSSEVDNEDAISFKFSMYDVGDNAEKEN